MSKYNYGSPGAEELQEKLTAFTNGTECVWLVHTGVEPDKLGVEVITPQQHLEPVTDTSVLPDAGLGLNISSQQIFE